MKVTQNIIESISYTIECNEQERCDIVDALSNMVLNTTSTRNDRFNAIAFKLKDANINEHW